MKIGELEKLVREVLVADPAFVNFVSSDRTFIVKRPVGLENVFPYVIIEFESEANGPHDTLTTHGVLEVQVWFKETNFVHTHQVLNRVSTLLHGQVVASSGYFGYLSFKGAVQVPVPESMKNVVARGVLFDVREAF